MADVIDVLLRMRGTRQFVAEAGAAEAAVAGIGTAEKTSAGASAKAATSRAKSRKALDKVSRSAGILALATGALGAISYKAAADFERSLSIFGATAGVAQKDLGGARKEAIKLGNDAKLPSVTARDAADALTELAKGGFEADEAIAAARGTLLLSQAAQMDAADSTTILARTLKSFDLDADQSERVVDAMAAAALKSTVGLREIADGMSYASQTSKMMGVSVEDTTAALAMLNDAGQVGAKAGASFQIMMSRLTKTTPAATKVMKKLGLITKEGNNLFYDRQGRFVGIRKASEVLTKSLEGLTDQQRLEYLTTIFNQRGMRAANILLGQGAGAYDKYRNAVGKRGAAEKLAAAQAQGSAGVIERLKNAWETLSIQLGTVLAPAIDALLQPLTRLLTFMGKHSKATTILILAIGGLAAGIWLLNAAMKAALVIRELITFFKLAAIAARIWSIMNIQVAISMYTIPIFWIIGGVILLGIAFVVLYKKVGWFRRAVQQTFGWIKKNWPYLLAALTGPFGLAVVLIIKHFDKIKKAVRAVIDFIKRQLDRIKDLPGMGTLTKIAGGAAKIGGFAKKGWSAVPHAASGGTVARAGTVMVGESGAELVHLPQAAQVQPLNLSGSGVFGAATIPVKVVLDRKVVAQATARYAADKVARR